MKKYLSFILVFVMLLFASLSVCAGSEMNIKVQYDGINHALIISGEVAHAKSAIPLVLKVSKAGQLIDMKQTVADDENNGYVSFEFEAVNLSKMAVSGAYTIYVSGRYIGTQVETVYQYQGIDDAFPKILTAKQLIGSLNADELMSYLSANAAVLGIDLSLYGALSSQGTATVKRLLLSHIFNLPADITTQSNAEQAFDELVTFRKAYYDAITIAQFYETNGLQTWNQWYTNYLEYLNLSEDNLQGKLYEYFEDINQSQTFVSLLINSKSSFKTIGDVRNRLYECGLLANMATNNTAIVKKIMTDFPQFFNVDTQKSKLLTTTQLDMIYVAMVGQTFITYSDAVTRFNELVLAKINELNDDFSIKGGSTSNGGSGSGGNWGKATGSGELTINKSVDTDKGMPFMDLNGYDWATTAVTYLYSKAIVNGISDTKFAPQDKVTRGAFMKMMVLAMGLEVKIDSVSSFTDVKAGDWYSPYITVAQNTGLTKGYENGTFRPNDYITREDVAVLLARAVGADLANGETSFADNNQISDYALVAVNMLAQKKVVNGVGANLFAPKENTTRAETAQILYNCYQAGLLK